MKPENSSDNPFHELAFYTLAHPHPSFIHQHAVDAFTAQHATNCTKPIALWFALIGLFLHCEKNYTGKAVQEAHVYLSRQTKSFPPAVLPESRGHITVTDVLAASAGAARDQAIYNWANAVWQSYAAEQEKIRRFTNRFLS